MHEMSLAESVREIVDETARANCARRVAAVRLEIGKLAQVEIDAMRFAFDVAMRGSLAESARLEIVETDGAAWCMRCSQPVAIARRGDACPLCGTYQLQVTGGERMRVMDMEIE
jgi:hydrogenase nickel incorporation protein HypA/HybF